MKEKFLSKEKTVSDKSQLSYLSPVTQALLDWFYLYGREMPWRQKGGAHENPYFVWISEIMLQQTTVKTVIDYFNRWIVRFPSVEALANADIQDVLLAWQGLGYYTRAKKIHECAHVLMQKYQGKIPNNRALLLQLPGIGPYSASSICAFAFNQPETVVDGNVVRVIARLYGLTHAVTKEEIYELAQPLTPLYQGADYASAIMDLGATVCTPSNPDCLKCPLQKFCKAYQNHLTESIPLIKKSIKKNKTGYVYLIQNRAGAFYIEKRKGKGLLSGLYEFPWRTKEEASYPLFSETGWYQTNKTVSHTFTHFQLTLQIVRLKTDIIPLTAGVFVMPEDFQKYPFSTLMKKVMKHLIEKEK